MSEPPVRLIGRRILADASFLRLERHYLADGDGGLVARDVVRHPGAVAVVAMDGGDVVFIEQWRVALGRPLLEIPAGKLDVAGEDPMDAARRELIEETGLVPASLEHVATIHTSPGFCDEAIAIFYAERVTATTAAPVGAEERAASIVRLPLDDALGAIATGAITDAKTIAGITAVARRR